MLHGSRHVVNYEKNEIKNLQNLNILKLYNEYEYKINKSNKIICNICPNHPFFSNSEVFVVFLLNLLKNRIIEIVKNT